MAEKTYYYIFVPNDSENYSNGSASATTKAKTPITLTATAQGWDTIELTWTDSGGKLYRSEKEGSEPGDADSIYISRGDDENNDAVTDYSDADLKSETTYYYIFVPNSGDFSRGQANAKTEKAPTVVIERFNIPDTVQIGVLQKANLEAKIEGVTPDTDTPVKWVWSIPTLKFSTEAPADWNSVSGAGSASFSVSYSTVYLPPGETEYKSLPPGTALQRWMFNTEGYYLIKNKVTATFKVNGRQMTLESK